MCDVTQPNKQEPTPWEGAIFDFGNILPYFCDFSVDESTFGGDLTVEKLHEPFLNGITFLVVSKLFYV